MATVNNSIMEIVSNPKNWKKTRKKSYEVYMCRPLPGTGCVNVLENAKYVTDQNKQFILSGTVGETWVIDINKLVKTYTFADGSEITPESLSKKCDKTGQIDWIKLKTRPNVAVNWALFLPKNIQNFPVQTSWGDVLYANRQGIDHGHGDFLVCADDGAGHPNLSDVWVVNGKVFPTTYDLHAFSNMFSNAVASANTIQPKTSFVKKATGVNENRGAVSASRVNNNSTLTKRGISMNTSSKDVIMSLYKLAQKAKAAYHYGDITVFLEDKETNNWRLVIDSLNKQKSVFLNASDSNEFYKKGVVSVVSQNFNYDDLSDELKLTYVNKADVNNFFRNLSLFFKNDAYELLSDVR